MVVIDAKIYLLILCIDRTSIVVLHKVIPLAKFSSVRLNCSKYTSNCILINAVFVISNNCSFYVHAGNLATVEIYS